VNRRRLISLGIAGLVLASNLLLVVSFAGNKGVELLGAALGFDSLTRFSLFGMLGFGAAAAVLASLLLLGSRPTRALFRWLIPTLIAATTIVA
jgi:hypothetical protein